MAQRDEGRVERRRTNRTALRLSATLRDVTRSRTQVRIIDMSTHGCRIESPFGVAVDSWVWLAIAGLEAQYCRVAWHYEEFVGLEFETPLAEPVFERLLADCKKLPDTAIKDLLNIATRTHWLARQASDANIAILAELSRNCAEDAVVEGLRLNAPAKGSSASK